LGEEIGLWERCEGMLESASLEEESVRAGGGEISWIVRVDDVATVRVEMGISEGRGLLKDVDEGFCGEAIAVLLVGGVEDAFGIRVFEVVHEGRVPTIDVLNSIRGGRMSEEERKERGGMDLMRVATAILT
jgi:hypothetical protein